MSNSYGYCPKCGAPGARRERRPNGNDMCVQGHVYPSAAALTAPKAEHLHDQLTPPAPVITDADRYRWIRGHLAQLRCPHMGGQHSWHFRMFKGRGPTLDAAIDDAMRNP